MNLKKLNSVGSAIDMRSGITYPMTDDTDKLKDIDFSNGTHIEECSGEWFNKLDSNDHSIIHEFFVREDGLI